MPFRKCFSARDGIPTRRDASRHNSVFRRPRPPWHTVRGWARPGVRPEPAEPCAPARRCPAGNSAAKRSRGILEQSPFKTPCRNGSYAPDEKLERAQPPGVGTLLQAVKHYSTNNRLTKIAYNRSDDLMKESACPAKARRFRRWDAAKKRSILENACGRRFSRRPQLYSQTVPRRSGPPISF